MGGGGGGGVGVGGVVVSVCFFLVGVWFFGLLAFFLSFSCWGFGAGGLLRVGAPRFPTRAFGTSGRQIWVPFRIVSFLPAHIPCGKFHRRYWGAESCWVGGCRPFFKKSENFHGPGAEHQAQHQSHYDAEFHGTGGPLQTAYSITYGASHQHWHSTLHKLGVQTNRSHFSGSNVGVWTSLTGVEPKKRERCYSANAYYRPVRDRKNLVLLTQAVAREVLLEREGEEWVAKGVRFMHGGEEHVVRTSGEVIICGGSVSSPQLLELSGIGNPEILKAAGIEIKVDNPNVGENLQEHMSKSSQRSLPVHRNTIFSSKLQSDIIPSDSNDIRN